MTESDINMSDPAGHLLVSVIIPSYNAADFLPFSVESVFAQTYQHIEVIVVDDGSTDHSISVLEGLAAKYGERFKWILQENGRQGRARNNGIRNSSGELIAFLDADDEWEPDKLEIQVKQLIEHQADLVFCDGWLIKTAETQSLRSMMKTGIERVVMGAFHGELSGKSGLRLLHRKNRIPTSAVLCTRKSIEQSGYFIEDLKFQNCEDYHLWVKMEERGFVLKGFENQLLLYRMHPGSSTSSALKSLKPLLNTLFIMSNPLTEDLKVQVAGHMQSYINALTQEAKLEAGNDLFALYNSNVEEVVWRILLNFTFRVSPGKLYQSFLWRHTARWVARDVDDEQRKQLRPD